MTSSGTAWHVLMTRPSRQKQAEQNLLAWAKVTDVYRPVERVVFSGPPPVERELHPFGPYLFVQADLTAAATWQACMACLGVARVLGGASPLPLVSGVVEALKAAERPSLGLSGHLADEVLARFAPGTEWQIEDGPFSGHVGKVDADALDQQRRVQMLLALFGRPFVVGVEPKYLRGFGDRPGAARYDRVVRGSR